MLLRISFPCSVGKQKFAVNYFRDLLVAPQIELIFTILSFHRIGSVVFIDTLSFMQSYPQSSVNN